MVTEKSLLRNVLDSTYAQALLHPKPGSDRAKVRRSGVVADENGVIRDPAVASEVANVPGPASTVRWLPPFIV